MPLDQIANFVRGSTDAAVDSTQTTISVVDATVFPDPANGEYNLVLWDDGAHPRPDQDANVEIVRVTGRDTGTDDLTVDRGQELTSGASHPSGSALQLSPTAGVFDDVAATDRSVEDFPTAATTTGEVLQVTSSNTTGFGSVDHSDLTGINNPPHTDRGLSELSDISPWEQSNVGSDTVNLDTDYDKVIIDIRGQGKATRNLQINGITSGYDYVQYGGNAVTGNSSWNLDAELINFERITLVHESTDDVVRFNARPLGQTYAITRSGEVSATGINSITLTDDASSFNSWRVRVYGTDI